MQYIVEVYAWGVEVKPFRGQATSPKFRVFDHEPTDEEVEAFVEEVTNNE